MILCEMCNINEAQHWVKRRPKRIGERIQIEAMCSPCVGVLQATIEDEDRRKKEKAEVDSLRKKRRTVKAARRITRGRR